MTTDAPTDRSEVEQVDRDEARRLLLTAVADDELITGHRHSHWTGVAPSIEEDLAFSTIAQDEINHADVWYQLIVGQDREDIDRIGLGREPGEYRHAVLCERPPGDFAFTLARHWAYDHFDAVRLRAMAGSSDPEIAAVASKLTHEERYHLEHADHWFRRLAAGGEESHARLAEGLRTALPDALWLFEPLPHEETMVAEGLTTAYTAALMLQWLETVVPMLEETGLSDAIPAAVRGWDQDGWTPPTDLFDAPGGRHGRHSEDFTEDVWPEMTSLYRAHPGARW